MLLDYTEFFDIHDTNKDNVIKCNYDFNTTFSIFLEKINCNPYFIRSICNTIFASMTNDKCHYHTPVHILSMLSCAEKFKIELKDYEILAILFHDSIYKPGSKKNEPNSIQFMLTLLDDTGVSENIKMNASNIIIATSMHLENDLDPICNTVLDLDMAGFSASKKYYDIQNECIKKEFISNLSNYGGYTEKEYLIGRKQFLTSLKNKKSIYRTEFFINYFEQIAQTNLMDSLNRL